MAHENANRGIETIAEDEKVPTQRIALCLVFGFVLMLIVEQVIAPNEHSHSMDIPIHKISDASSHVEFDADIEGFEATESSLPHSVASSTAPNNPNVVASSERAFALFLGLVIHAAADGLALGVANLDRNETGKPDPLTFIVFLALILHKGNISISPAPRPQINSQLQCLPLWHLQRPYCPRISPDRIATNMSPSSVLLHH